MFLFDIPFFMFLADFIFVVSHWKIHPAVHLNTPKVRRHCIHKEKFIKGLPAFVNLMFYLVLKKDKKIGENLDVQIE